MKFRVYDVENAHFFSQFIARIFVHNFFRNSQFYLPKADYERRHGEFPRYFPGWYLFTPSRDLEEGEVVSKKLNGKDLVAYRDANGKPVIHSNRCTHMDGLFSGGLGTVKDGNIVCPYHEIPFDHGKPQGGPSEFRNDPKNCIPTHPVVETHGLVMFWFDPAAEDGISEPAWELDLPDVSDLPRMAHCRSITPTHMAPLHENIVDDQHFMKLHAADRYRSTPQAYYEKHRFRTENTMRVQIPDKIGPFKLPGKDRNLDMVMDSEFHGLGIHINTVDVRGFKALVIHTTTPIEDEVTEWHLNIYMPKRDWKNFKLDAKNVFNNVVYPWGMVAQTWNLHTQDRRTFFEKAEYRFYNDAPKGCEKVNMFRRWIHEELMGEERPRGPNSVDTTYVSPEDLERHRAKKKAAETAAEKTEKPAAKKVTAKKVKAKKATA